MKTILLTGGSGVIGTILISKLIKDYKIIAIGKDYSRIDEGIRHHKNFKFYERDFLKIRSRKDINIAEHVDLIIHMAGIVTGKKQTEANYFQINAESTRYLAELAKAKQCKAMALTSSVSVYGIQNQNLILKSPRLGTSVYARSKIKAEQYLESIEVTYSIFRIGSIYGKGTKSFVTKLMSIYRKGFYPSLMEERKKSIIHINDVVSALVSWVEKTSAGKPILPIYVLSHPEAVSIKDVVSELFEQKVTRFRGVAIPIYPFTIPIFDWLYRTIRRLRRVPFHESPLAPLLHSIEIFDEGSWQDLTISPKWNLRKGIADYK